MPLIRRRTFSEDAEELRAVMMGDGRFLPVLVMTLISLFLSVSENSGTFVQVLTVVAFGATLLLALWRSGVSRVVFQACAILCIAVGVLASIRGFVPLGESPDAHVLTIVLRCLLALVVLVTFAVVLRAAVRQHRVTLDTLAAALTSYLMIGVFFSLMYRVIAGATGHFFAQTDAPSANDFVYFSFVTLTTTGYGDLTPAGGLPRGSVVFEVILGQVYLVTIISLVVAHLGRVRAEHPLSSIRAAGADDDDDDPDPDAAEATTEVGTQNGP